MKSARLEPEYHHYSFNDDIYETKPRYCTAIFHRLTRELLLIIVDPDPII